MGFFLLSVESSNVFLIIKYDKNLTQNLSNWKLVDVKCVELTTQGSDQSLLMRCKTGFFFNSLVTWNIVVLSLLR